MNLFDKLGAAVRGLTKPAEPAPQFDGHRCDACDGEGFVLCRCAGDLCVCENHGEKVCPVCAGRSAR